MARDGKTPALGILLQIFVKFRIKPRAVFLYFLTGVCYTEARTLPPVQTKRENAEGRQRRTNSGKKDRGGSMFRFGIIGSGDIANKFCDAVKEIEGAEVAATSSKSPDRARAFAQKNGVPAWYGDYEEMLQKEALDAVYIATVHRFHYENIMLCLRYNKAVLCEKCCVLTRKEALEVCTLAREKGLFFMECMWSRFLPGNQKAREWVLAGKAGQIQTASYSIGFRAHPGHRVLNPAIAGGALYDIGVYAIEGLTYLVNQPLEAVTPVVQLSEKKVDVSAFLTLRFAQCLASVQCSVLAGMNAEARIYGTKGKIVLPNALSSYECRFYGSDGTEEVFRAPSEENSFVPQIRAAMACLAQGQVECPVIPHRDTMQCAEIFDLSLGTGEPVTLRKE